MDGVWDNERGHLLLEGGDFIDRNGKVGDPAKDVRMEADVVLRDVQSSLDEDFALEGASVV